MRNYDQLVQAAEATGTYANYIGDGASVPWQCAQSASLPLGMTFQLYKFYLDLHWWPGFKLHDWMYTPYSLLIDGTREEADLALYEFIARDSGVDALIVYTAVRQGGAGWWQRSQTGYTGLQNQGSALTIVLPAVDP